MLVMTPQLRQAIKLLQFNNLEAAAFVEEELERNPLLERDERSDAPIEQPAVDQPAPALAESADTADLVGAASIPEEGSGPLDTEFDGYEAYGAADRRVSTPTIAIWPIWWRRAAVCATI
jgi:RNA polymerase sigma-54 factor